MGGIKGEGERAKVDANPAVSQASEETRVLNNLEASESRSLKRKSLVFPGCLHAGQRLPHWAPPAGSNN